MSYVHEISAAIAAVPMWNWVVVLAGILLAIPFAYIPHFKQAFHQCRLDRRLARDPLIYQEELHEYEYRIGEDLDEVDWRAILWAGIGNGLMMSGFFILQKLEAEWAPYLLFGLFAASIIYGFWRYYTDAETKGDDPYGPPSAEIPDEAIWGLMGGVLFVFAIVMFAISIF